MCKTEPVLIQKFLDTLGNICITIKKSLSFVIATLSEGSSIFRAFIDNSLATDICPIKLSDVTWLK